MSRQRSPQVVGSWRPSSPRELPEIRASRRSLRARVPRSERAIGIDVPPVCPRGPSKSTGMTAPARPLAVNRATAKLVFFHAPREETEPMRLQCFGFRLARKFRNLEAAFNLGRCTGDLKVC